MKNIIFASAITGVLLTGNALAHDCKVGSLIIKHPWSRATPGGATVGAGYLEIVNTGSEADRLVGGSVEIAGKFELHVSEVVGGIMKMRPATDGLEVPAGGTVALAPGASHAMMVGLKQPLKEGQIIRGTLQFEKAGAVTLEFKVEGLTYRPKPTVAVEADHSSHGTRP